jgi:Cytochrome P460
MKSTRISTVVTIALVLAIWGGGAVTAQDKYAVQVPGGLTFSEFRGYETWEVVAVSQTREVLNVILANPVMINAYRAGVPGNGQPVPDGSKIAKIQWRQKESTEAPDPTKVPDTLKDVAFMEKDANRFSDGGGWGYAMFNYDPASDRSRPMGVRGRVPHKSEGKGLRLHGVREEVNGKGHRVGRAT